MNDGNIRHYLETEMADLKALIKNRNDDIEVYNQRIDDALKQLRNLRVHYTSLLNTAIAYGFEQDMAELDAEMNKLGVEEDDE